MTHLAACIARQLPALAEHRSDGELLAGFLADRDEAAFAELVRRHGPLVWGACRLLLPDPADTEDAFQATFLVLVRRAGRLTGRAALGPWLYRVAVWTARNVRRRNARTFARRAPLSPFTADPNPGPAALDLRADLDGALLSLPEKYRTPLVLCHLQGWSRREAAARLGCPEGTLSSLLSRGLARLRAKLGDHDPAKILAVTATVPAVLAATTVRAAAAARCATAGAITSSVSQLAEGVIRMFWVKKATVASFALVAVFGMGLGVGVSVQQVPGATAGDGPASPSAATPVDYDKEIAKLEYQISGWRTTVVLVSDWVKTQERNIERAEKERTRDPKEIAKDRQALASARKLVIDTDQRIQDAKAAIKALETKRAKSAVAQTPTPVTKPPADLVARLEKITKEHAASRKRIDALRATVKASVQKLELAKINNDLKAADAARDEIEQAHKALVPEIEKAAWLDGMRAALEEELKTQPAPPKPEPKPATREDKYSTELERAKAAAEKAEKQLEELRQEYSEFDKRLPALLHPNGYLELTIGTRNATWPYQVKEYGRDGKPIGTAAFENAEVLGRFLTRIAKDPTGPRNVRITTQAGVKADLFKSAVDVCRVAGFKTLSGDIKAATLLDEMDKRRDKGTGRDLSPSTREALRRLNEEYMKQADADAFNKQIEELSRQLEELRRRYQLEEKSSLKEREDRDRQIEELNKLIRNKRKESEDKSKPLPPAKKP